MKRPRVFQLIHTGGTESGILASFCSVERFVVCSDGVFGRLLRSRPLKRIVRPFYEALFLANMSGRNNTAMCLCITAAGSWEPVVGVEYLMREWILSLGRLSKVCKRKWTRKHVRAGTRAHTYVYAQRVVAQLLCCSTLVCQAGASEVDIRVFMSCMKSTPESDSFFFSFSMVTLQNH